MEVYACGVDYGALEEEIALDFWLVRWVGRVFVFLLI